MENYGQMFGAYDTAKQRGGIRVPFPYIREEKTQIVWLMREERIGERACRVLSVFSPGELARGKEALAAYGCAVLEKGEGRISEAGDFALPAAFARHAGDAELTVVGMGNYFEIWLRAEHEQMAECVMGFLADFEEHELG